MWLSGSKNIGEFVEAEYGAVFTYEETSNTWAKSHGLTHEVHTIDGNRFAIVKKTVIYFCTDEDEYGNPVLEKWKIEKHIVYNF